VQCTSALPEFIIPAGDVMINLIGAASRQDEVRQQSCLSGKMVNRQRSGLTPMSEGSRPQSEESPVIVRLSIIVGFLLVLFVIVALRKP
jgi:hypothetical protein